MAMVFAAYGSRVTIIEVMDRLVPAMGQGYFPGNSIKPW
jgi:pyruvate/2-oxoglutarate dehydrogenase complex dihydrolipoamide dehydrogenase (E3) component